MMYTQQHDRYLKNIEREAKISFKWLKVTDFLDEKVTNGHGKRDYAKRAEREEGNYDDI